MSTPPPRNTLYRQETRSSRRLTRTRLALNRAAMPVAGAMRDYFDAITKEGASPAITPDGPRGPAREFKAGAILLSQLSGKPMLPMAFAARRVCRFPTWDDFILPLPGTRAVLAVGEPRIAPKRTDAVELGQRRQRMQAELSELYRLAQTVLRHQGRPGL